MMPGGQAVSELAVSELPASIMPPDVEPIYVSADRVLNLSADFGLVTLSHWDAQRAEMTNFRRVDQ